MLSAVNSSPSFGKSAVMRCVVKDAETQEPIKATLYKLDLFNPSDYYDVYRSKNTCSIQSDFCSKSIAGNKFSRPSTLSTKYYDYYLLQNNKTSEVISCCKTSHNYRSPLSENDGASTLVSKLGMNKKYINGIEPMLAYITKVAAERYDNSVYTSYNIKNSSLCCDFDEGIAKELRHCKFTDSDKDGSYITKRRFNSFLDRAEEHSNIVYV